MCTHSPLNRLRAIEIELLEKSAVTSEYTPTAVVSLFRLLIDRLKGVADPWSKVVCDISLTADYHLLAGVQKGSCGRYGIFVDVTVPLQMLVVFSRLLAHHKVLTDIPPLPLPVSERPALWILNRPPRVAKDGVREAPREQSGLRGTTVNSLIERAIYFLFMHEIGHIHERHGDYFDRVLLVDPSTRRGLEHRADWFALQICLNREEAYRKLPSFRLWGFAVATLFAVLDVVNSPIADSPYPRANCRSFLCEGFVSTQMSSHSIDEAAIKDFTCGMEEARNAWDYLGWPATGEPTMEEVEQGVSDIKQAELVLKKFA